MSGTVKDNILFGKKYNKQAFLAALKAACLDHDIKDFNNGEDTTIGERGINISGG